MSFPNCVVNFTLGETNMRRISKFPFVAALGMVAALAVRPAAAQIPILDELLPGISGQSVQPATAAQSSFPDFTGNGEADFKAGRYAAAIQNWRHALVDDPHNGGLVLMLSQALLQLGQYDEAAGAAQAGIRMLPAEKWGAVVVNYKELYGNFQEYTSQLKVIEKARDAKPESPAIHFLLGYNFGFLGYPKHAVRELDKVIELEPKDEIAVKLRDYFKAKLEPGSAVTPAPTGADDKPAKEAAPAAKAAEKGPAESGT
jgi:tetratricopeptide (TPR) repeat protein